MEVSASDYKDMSEIKLIYVKFLVFVIMVMSFHVSYAESKYISCSSSTLLQVVNELYTSLEVLI
jgi:hypothetical protein